MYYVVFESHLSEISELPTQIKIGLVLPSEQQTVFQKWRDKGKIN